MAKDPVVCWAALAARQVASVPGVEKGRMMSADALTWRGRVFAFYSTRGGRPGLGCRLGREFDVEALALGDWQYLAPFRTKPPMKDWIVAGWRDIDRWPELVETALEIAMARKG